MKTVHSGELERRQNRITGTVVSVYDAEQGGFDPEGGKYAVVCEQHSTIVNVGTLRLATQTLAFPDFCEECQAKLYEHLSE
jgi:hypothetical protein